MVWRPGAERIARSRVERLLRAEGVADLDALRRRAAGDPAWYWETVPRDLGWRWREAPRQILDLCEGARLRALVFGWAVQPGGQRAAAAWRTKIAPP